MSAEPTLSASTVGKSLGLFLQRLTLLWLAGGIAVTWATLAARTWWVGEVLASLRIQILLALLPLLLLTMGLRSYRRMSVTLLLALWHGFFLRDAVLPPTSASATPAPGERTFVGSDVKRESSAKLSICLANVWVHNRDFGRICRTLRGSGADLLAVVELSDTLEAAIHEQLDQDYPYFIAKSDGLGAFGIGLWSRYPLAKAEIVHFAVDWLPSISAEVDVQGVRTRVVVTHPTTPLSEQGWLLRNSQLGSLADQLGEMQSAPAESRAIVAGDLNLTPWSPLYPQLLQRAGLKDTAAGTGLTPTWYGWPSFACGLMLDHVWYSPQLRCLRRRILPDLGSDHRPLFVEFEL